MSSEFILALVILFCLFVLAVLIRFLAAGRRKDVTGDDIYNRVHKGMQNPDEAIREFIRQGKVLQAIKLVKETKNITLKEAKNYVENFELSLGDENEGIIFESASGKALSREELDGKISELIMQNKKVSAIRLVMENLNIGLKKAKFYVEKIESSLNL
jgi:ribosomal protein L7/L12